jgi:hypothetical protein
VAGAARATRSTTFEAAPRGLEVYRLFGDVEPALPRKQAGSAILGEIRLQKSDYFAVFLGDGFRCQEIGRPL